MGVCRFLLYNEVALPVVRRQVSSAVVEGGAGGGDGEDKEPKLEQVITTVGGHKALQSDDSEDVARLTIEVSLPHHAPPPELFLMFSPDHECG